MAGRIGATPSERGKQPRSIVAGPYGHPFHPVLVTVPIGCWTASVVFDLVALAGDDDKTFATGAFWLVVIGLAGATLAAGVGFLDLLTLPRGSRAFSVGVTHMVLNLTAVVLFVGSLLARGLSGGTDRFDLLGFALSVVGLLVVGASGWLGGKLVYHYGVRVADEQTQAAGFIRP